MNHILSDREKELIRKEHVLECQAEGMLRDLYVMATQRCIGRNLSACEMSMAEVSLIFHRMKDIESELNEIESEKRRPDTAPMKDENDEDIIN